MPERFNPPYWEDEGYESEVTPDPRHDTLISNPEYRERFQAAVESGMGYEEAHEHVRAELDMDEEDSGNGSPAEGTAKSLSEVDADYDAVDDALFDAITKSSWWLHFEYADEGEPLSKAPGIWRHGDEVPAMVRELIEEVIETTEWRWTDFATLSAAEAHRLEEIIAERMTQPQGWSTESITRDVVGEFGLDESTAAGVVEDTTHSVLNVAREEAYEEMDGSEAFEYSWVNPQDHRTTPVCAETIEEIEDRGGSVTMPELKEILRLKAQAYEGTSEGGGTPSRVDLFEPHYGCRSTVVREVTSI